MERRTTIFVDEVHASSVESNVAVVRGEVGLGPVAVGDVFVEVLSKAGEAHEVHLTITRLVIGRGEVASVDQRTVAVEAELVGSGVRFIVAEAILSGEQFQG